MSSARPSAKYACSGSSLRLANGSTAIEGPRACAAGVACCRACRGADGSDEAVADARDRRDPVGAVGRRPEQLAQRRDLHREVALLDRHARPAGVEQLGFGQHVAGPLAASPRARAQAAIADRHGHALSQQRSGFGLEHEGTEGEALARACAQVTSGLPVFGSFSRRLRDVSDGQSQAGRASVERAAGKTDGGNDERTRCDTGAVGTELGRSQARRLRAHLPAASRRRRSPTSPRSAGIARSAWPAASASSPRSASARAWPATSPRAIRSSPTRSGSTRSACTSARSGRPT